MSRLSLLAASLVLVSTPAPARAQIVGVGEDVRFAAIADEYGHGVAIDGDTLAIGAWLDDAAGFQAGSVHVYVRVGGSWTLQQRIDPTPVMSQYRFGESLALQGDRLVVGCSWDGDGQYQSGAVRVYERTGTTWSEVVKLKGSNVANNRNLGRSVALDGDTIVAGAPHTCCASSPAGDAHVFRRVGGVWTEEAVLTGLATGPSDAFGSAVALRGDLLVVGQPRLGYGAGSANPSGAVHVFRRSGSAWTQTQRIESPFVQANAYFGSSVALDGTTFVVGAPNTPSLDGTQTGCGRLEVFDEIAGVFAHVATLTANDASTRDSLGESVAMEGDLIVGGAPPTFPGIGGAYVFERVAGAWNRHAKLAPSTHGPDDRIGTSVAIEGGRVLVGAPETGSFGGPAGSALLYALPAAPIGTTTCVGDGASVPCPCSNASPVGAQLGCRNAASRGSWIVAVGSASVSAGDLAFDGHGVPYAPCTLVGSTTSIGAVPFGNGLRCVQSPIALQMRQPVGASVHYGPGLAPATGWAPGQTWTFQVLHRSRPYGTCVGGMNASSAVTVALVP